MKVHFNPETFAAIRKPCKLDFPFNYEKSIERVNAGLKAENTKLKKEIIKLKTQHK